MTRTAEVTSRIMASVPDANTKPERTLRSELHRRGLRHRVHRRMFRKPDITFVGARVAVFVDGDYWQGSARRTRGYADFDSYYARGENAAFWFAKTRRDIDPDRHVTEGLRAAGWCVIRVWETAMAADLNEVAERIERAVPDRTA